MLKTDRPVYKVVLILSLILIVGGICICAINVFNQEDLAAQIASALSMVSLALAAYYIADGYTKDAAKYYKVFAGFFSVASLAVFVSAALRADSPVASLTSGVTFVLIATLFLGKNMGKFTSLLLCAFAALIRVAGLALTLAFSLDPMVIVRTAIPLLLTLLLWLMTYAKYLDKADRGRE